MQYEPAEVGRFIGRGEPCNVGEKKGPLESLSVSRW